jgi:hypothetical protein
MPLPHSTDACDDEKTICLIAEHAIRRLLNRIHSALYGPEVARASGLSETSTDPTDLWRNLSSQRLMGLTSELNRQLEEWYSSIPESLRPQKGAGPLSNDRLRILRIRYYTARHIIHRPYVLQSIVRGEELSTSSAVLEKGKVCIESCLAYLYNALDMIDKRSPYLWSLSQGCMACLIMLWIAEDSPILRQYVPNMEPIKAMALARLRKWASVGSSFDAEVQILERLAFSDS